MRRASSSGPPSNGSTPCGRKAATTSLDFTGLSVSGYNRVRGLQTGVAIGVYNSAKRLQGVQIGLLNRALKKKPPFRYLPIINAHF